MKNEKMPPRPAANMRNLGRVVKMLFEYYPVLAPVTGVCILLSAIVSAIPSLFTKKVIEIIEKWVESGDWISAKAELVPVMALLITLYVISIISVIAYTQMMAFITQGFLCKMRRTLFDKMQDLPIKYFDTHKHGDIMSTYTNDIDTLRQLVSQSLPALIKSAAIVTVVFSIMLYYSLWLTLLVVGGVFLMVFVSKKIGGGSAKYFIRQQKAMGKVEGYIQEIMNGQRVVKVFCHEEESKAEFDRVNDELYNEAVQANRYANVLGPILGNIGKQNRIGY